MPNLEEAMAKIGKKKSPKKRRPYIADIPRPRAAVDENGDDEDQIDSRAEKTHQEKVQASPAPVEKETKEKVNSESVYIHPAIHEDGKKAQERTQKNIESSQAQTPRKEAKEDLQIERDEKISKSTRVQDLKTKSPSKTKTISESFDEIDLENDVNVTQKNIVIKNPVSRKNLEENLPKFSDELLVNIEDWGKSTVTVLKYLINAAVQNKNHLTSKVRKKELCAQTGMNPNTCRSCIRRLTKANAIRLIDHRRGVSGWSKYQINEDIYGELSFFDEIPEMKNNSYSNAVSEAIDIEIPANLSELGFAGGHLSQLKRQGIDFNVIQRSLDAFSFDMKNEEYKARQRSPISVIMKIMKSEGEYLSCTGYVDPEENLMAKQVELKKKAKLERQRLKQELFDLSFEEWVEDTPDSKIRELVPSDSFQFMGQIHRAQVEEYFRERVFKDM